MTRPDSLLLNEIHRQLHEIFAAFASGKDVAPAKLYRAEGMLQSAILLELITLSQARGLIADQAQAQLGRQPVWLSEGVEIPMMMKRAPVRPST